MLKTHDYYVVYSIEGSRIFTVPIYLDHPIRDMDDIRDIEDRLIEHHYVNGDTKQRPTIFSWQKFEKE